MANRQVTAQQITNALLEWRGNVEQAAHSLGIRRNSLYERIQRLGLNLEGFRAMNRKMEPVTRPSGVPRVFGQEASSSSGRRKASGPARNSHSASVTEEDKRRKFTRMEAVGSGDAIEAPIKAAPGRFRPPRLRPTQQDRLRDAKLDLGAHYRVETDESLILQQFFDERFEDWFSMKLAPSGAGQEGGKRVKTARRERTEGEDEKGDK